MRRPHILRPVEEPRVIWRVFRAGGFPECCDMLRAGLVALRRFGVSVWFAMLRFGVTRRTGSRWHGMTRRECAAMRRYASVRGVRYDMARILPGSRSEDTGPSHNVALCRAACRGDPGVCGSFFPEYRAASGPCGGLIGAGSGSVRAPGVPVPVTVCVLVQVRQVSKKQQDRRSRCLSRYVSWCKWRTMARLLSLVHCPAVKYGVSL